MATEKDKAARQVGLWNPFGEEFFSPERFFREWSVPSQRVARLAPAVDVSEDEKSYHVTVELPGVKKDDVTVEVHENVLSIRGEKKSEREEKKDKTHWVERTFGSFSRSFTLPPSAVADELKAGFKDGVLTLEIPKKEEAKPRQISIK
jgi:HSP20 family protein